MNEYSEKNQYMAELTMYVPEQVKVMMWNII